MRSITEPADSARAGAITIGRDETVGERLVALARLAATVHMAEAARRTAEQSGVAIAWRADPPGGSR